MVKVSVVVPVYNTENYLEGSIKSLLNQTEQDIELIFIDDGSTDNSYKILSKYAKIDKRIIIKKIENSGPGVARNIGLDIAKGEYVIFLDADDLFSKELVEVLYRKAKQGNADVTICSALRYDEILNLEKPFIDALKFHSIPYGKSSFSPKEANQTLFQITGAFAWNKLFRREFLKSNNLKFYDSYCYEDMALVYPALIRAEKIAVTHQELIKYRINAGESLSDNRDKYWKALIEVLSYLDNDIQKMGKYSMYEQTYLNKVATILTQVFRAYIREEAFIGVFDFARKNIMSKLMNKSEKFYYEKIDGMVMSIFINTDMPLEFALKIFNIREQVVADVTNRYWLFPYSYLKKNSKVVLFGAGDVGRDMYIQNKQSKWCDIVAWVDSVPEKYTHKGFPVRDKDVLKELEFDVVLICIRNEEISQLVKEELVSYGIDEYRIIIYPEMVEKDIAVCIQGD